MSEVARFETMLVAIAEGFTWPPHQMEVSIPSIRNPKLKTVSFEGMAFQIPEDIALAKDFVSFRYTKPDYDSAVLVVTKVQSAALSKAAEKLRFAMVEGGPRWAIRYDQLMDLSEDVLMSRVPL